VKKIVLVKTSNSMVKTQILRHGSKFSGWWKTVGLIIGHKQATSIYKYHI